VRHIAARAVGSGRATRPWRAIVRGVARFDNHLFVLPSGAGGHGADPDLLRAIALQRGWEGWLVGCREQRAANDDPHARRVVVATPLCMVGVPPGALADALARAGAREGCEYVLAAPYAAVSR
jgi:hypothetical protein